jgi:uncharacterized protein (TIRG00374 family)
VTSRAFKGSLALLAGAAAFWLWWRTFDGPHVAELVLRTEAIPVAAGVGLMGTAQLFRLLRWHLLLRRVGAIPIARTFRLLYASELLNNLLPVKVGDIGRAVALAGRSPDFTIGSATASMVVDRLYGILARVLTLALLPLVPSQLPGSLRLSIGIFTGALVAAAALLLAWSRHGDYFARLLSPLLHVAPARAREPVGRTLRNFADATVTLGIRPGLAAKLLALSLASLVTQAAGLSALFLAVGHRLPAAVALVGMSLLDLLAVVPAPPAGIGSAEWYGTLVFATALGQPTGPTAAAALLYHAAWLLIIFVACGLSIGAVGEMMPRRASAAAT